MRELMRTGLVGGFLLGLAAATAVHAQDRNQSPTAAARTPLDRTAVASEIVSRWAGSAQDGGAELRAALEGISPEALAAARDADSAADLNAAVFGRAVGPRVLGDATSDLVFFPLTPCRMVDTRVAGGQLSANTTRGFDSQAPYTAQGGSAASCGVPGSDVAALAVTLVAVGPAGAGDLRAFPFGATPPNASVINYALPGQGLNIANTTIIPLTQDALQTNEFSILADVAGTHLVVDVVGYFDRPALSFLSGTNSANSATLAASTFILSGTNIVPTRTLTCFVTADLAWAPAAAPASGFGYVQTAMRNVTTATNTDDGGWLHYLGALGDNRGSASKSSVWTLAPGATYQFGCHGIGTADYVGDTVFCTVTWDCR